MPIAAPSKKKWSLCFVAELLAFLLVLQKQVEKEKVAQKSINRSISRGCRYMGFGFYSNWVLGSNPFRTAGKTVKNLLKLSLLEHLLTMCIMVLHLSPAV